MNDFHVYNSVKMHHYGSTLSGTEAHNDTHLDFLVTPCCEPVDCPHLGEHGSVGQCESNGQNPTTELKHNRRHN